MTNGFANVTIEELRQRYVGKLVHVIYNVNGVEIDTHGTVTAVDSTGRLHGTWGPETVEPGKDYIGIGD